MAVCKRCNGTGKIECMACWHEYRGVGCEEPIECPICKGSGQETGSSFAGKPDEKIAKCVFNGKSEAMIFRNSNQTVYIPYMNDATSSMFRKVNSVIVIEKENYNMKEIIDVIQNRKFLFFSEKYKIKVENINSPLPIPEHEKSRLKTLLK